MIYKVDAWMGQNADEEGTANGYGMDITGYVEAENVPDAVSIIQKKYIVEERDFCRIRRIEEFCNEVLRGEP